MTMQTDLLRLLHRGWVSPIEALQEAQCLSLSQRVSELIRDGVPIKKRWLRLDNGKRVKEYTIDQAALARAASFARANDDGCYSTSDLAHNRVQHDIPPLV